MQDLVKFAGGAIMGFVATANTGPDVEAAKLRAEVEGQRKTIEQLEGSMSRLGADSMPRDAVNDVVRTVSEALAQPFCAEVVPERNRYPPHQLQQDRHRRRAPKR